MLRETQFLDSLARVTSYELDGTSLALLEGETVVATLEPSVPME
jgi:hypothetical protein